MKHTKGPWEVIKSYHGDVRIFRKGEDPAKIHSLAEVFGRQKGYGGSAEADAHLIAAAPEMYAALKKVLPLLKAYENGPWEEARNLVEAALKKVEGE